MPSYEVMAFRHIEAKDESEAWRKFKYNIWTSGDNGASSIIENPLNEND